MSNTVPVRFFRMLSCRSHAVTWIEDPASRAHSPRSCAHVARLVDHADLPVRISVTQCFRTECGCLRRHHQWLGDCLIQTSADYRQPHETRYDVLAGGIGHLSVDTQSDVSRLSVGLARMGPLLVERAGVRFTSGVHLLYGPLPNRTRGTGASFTVRAAVRDLHIAGAEVALRVDLTLPSLRMHCPTWAERGTIWNIL